MTIRTQWVRNDADAHLNRSILQTLSFMWPRNVSQDGPPESPSRSRWLSALQSTRMWFAVSLSIATPKANVICWGIRGQPQLRLRRFNSTTASMSSLFGPFGPGGRLRLRENNMRYFRLASTWWRCSSVDGFRTMAERRTRGGFMKRVHKPAMKRSAARRLGARLRPRLRMPSLGWLGDV